MLSVAGGVHASLAQCCHGAKGFCWTGQRHIELRGAKPGTGIKWTRIAEPYPLRLARAGAKALIDAAESIHVAYITHLAG